MPNKDADSAHRNTDRTSAAARESDAANGHSASAKLLLASSSKYRRQLLERLGLPFESNSPDIDETPLPGESPEALVVRLAEAKARALASNYPNFLIIGSDQVACVDGQILGKPGTVERAEAQLAALSGNSVHFYTGLALLNPVARRVQVDMDTTEVQFRELTTQEISAYIAREQPLDCAGSFKSEGLGVALFERIATEDPAALIGLPLVKLCEMLRTEQANPLLS